MRYRVLFSADNGIHGAETWITDAGGTSATLISDINPGSGDALNNPIGGVLGGYVYYEADDGQSGPELWRTDGTAAGTTLVREIFMGTNGSGQNGSFPSDFARLGSNLYFRADDGQVGQALWRTDGTAIGTVRVADFADGPGTKGISAILPIGDKLFLWAANGIAGVEPWISDGTAGGTRMIADINPGSGNGVTFFSQPVRFGDELLFAAKGPGGEELYATDGETVRLVRDINPGGDATPLLGADLNGVHYFVANDGTHGAELWRTDGTFGGTFLVKDINPFGTSGAVVLGATDDALFIAAADGSNGYELWVSDGISTNLLMDLNPGGDAVGFEAGRLARLGTTNRVVFAADDGVNGKELFVTDGTAGGTALLRDVFQGAGSSDPRQFTQAGDLVYFVATGNSAATGIAGQELWVTDGTTAGTRMVQDIAVGASGSSPHIIAILATNDPTPGNDTLTGTGGPDTIDGLAGNDVIIGQGGADRLIGNAGADDLRGGGGGDVLLGGGGADTANGGDGADDITGGAGLDRLIGGDGGDTINGAKGNDVVTGGRGADDFVFEGTFGRDRVTDFGRGADTIDLSDRNLTFAGLDIREANGGDDTLIVIGQNRITLTGFQADDLQAGMFEF